VTHFECAVLTALMFRRSAFLATNTHFTMAKPIFSSSRFLIASELGEIKLLDAMHELVDQLPDGFFGVFTEVWPQLRSEQGGALDICSLTYYISFFYC
jgi:hypothetical protein